MVVFLGIPAKESNEADSRHSSFRFHELPANAVDNEHAGKQAGSAGR
jgi:hypothetical protein